MYLKFYWRTTNLAGEKKTRHWMSYKVSTINKLEQLIYEQNFLNPVQ